MEKALSILASLITIFGFFAALSNVSSISWVGIELPSSIDPVFGSWLFALLSIFSMAVAFGYAFGSLGTAIVKAYGPITIPLVAPVLGLVSGFQSGATTLISVEIFGVVKAWMIFFGVSIFFSLMIETMFIFVHCGRKFSQKETLLGSEVPRASSSLTSLSAVFFCFGYYVSMLEGNVFASDFMAVPAALGCVVLAFIAFLVGGAFYEIIDDKGDWY